jgi:hypothetical protein
MLFIYKDLCHLLFKYYDFKSKFCFLKRYDLYYKDADSRKTVGELKMTLFVGINRDVSKRE